MSAAFSWLGHVWDSVGDGLIGFGIGGVVGATTCLIYRALFGCSN